MIDFLQNYYFLLLLPLILVPLVKRKGWWYLWILIYFAIAAFCVGGIYALLHPLLFPPSPDSDATRNVYYFLIFIGANFATAIAVWRGRQSKQQLSQFERQLENSRFEKAVDMATDPTSPARRGSGFRVLRQILSSWGKNFDDSTKKRVDILAYLALNNFEMMDDIRTSFQELYEDCRVRYSEEEHNLSESLYKKTHHPGVDNATLNLWGEIVNWNRRKFKLRPVRGIFATGLKQPSTHFFIFSGTTLIGANFLVVFGSGKIDFPTKKIYVNFSQCCFSQAQMQETNVSYVNFSASHLSRVNYINEGEDCNMKCIGTIFDFANLIDCNFRGADFEDASFVETNISGSDFSQTNLTPEQFKTAYWIRPGRPQFLKKARSKFPEDDLDNFLDGFTDKFVESLARDGQDEEEGQGGVKTGGSP